VYKGTERSGRVKCPGVGGRGSQKVKFVFKIVEADAGMATALRGRIRFEADCPNEDFFQKARFYAELKT
jgi:hypothetical protein